MSTKALSYKKQTDSLQIAQSLAEICSVSKNSQDEAFKVLQKIKGIYNSVTL